jgi:hypothetical protein
MMKREEDEEADDNDSEDIDGSRNFSTVVVMATVEHVW